MIYQKMKYENGQMVAEETKVIDQDQLSSECWLIQFQGKSACDHCEYKGKRECGGKDILKKGKNNKGVKLNKKGI
jgi:hypothetical protein